MSFSLKTKVDHLIQHIRNHDLIPSIKKYFGDFATLTAARLFSLLTSLFIGISIVRYLGPTQYGAMSYIFGLVGTVSFINNLGIDSITTNEIIKNPDKEQQILGSSILIKILGALIGIATLSVIVLNTNDHIFTKLLILLCSISYIYNSFTLFENYLQSKSLFKNIAAAQIITTIISSLIKIFLLYRGAGFGSFTIMLLIDSMILATSFYFQIRLKKIKMPIMKPNFELIGSLLKKSWPFIFSTAFYLIYMRIDQIIIKHLLGVTELGIYSAAVRIAETLYFIPGVVMSVILPNLIKNYSDNLDIYNKKIGKIFFSFFWSSAIISLIIFILSKTIIHLLFGNKFEGSAEILMIYTWSIIPVAMFLVVQTILTIKNKSFFIAELSMVGAISNVILNLLLIPRLGIAGSAAATLISYSLMTLATVIIKETRNEFYALVKGVFYIEKP